MAPVYERTWNCAFDNAYNPSTALDMTKYQLWSLKALLCGHLGGLISGLWSVYSSSDSATAGNGDGPGVDRWLATYDGTKIVRGTGGAVRSWIVLKSPTNLTGLGVSFYLTISFDGAADTSASLYMAKTAPTGGTTTARPTSTDEWVLNAAGAAWNAGTATPFTMWANIVLSTTGDFYFWTMQSGQVYSSLAVAVVAPVGCNSNDLFPVWAYKYFQTSSPGAFYYSQLIGSATMPTRMGNGLATSAYVYLLNFNGTFSANQADDMFTNKAQAEAPYVVAYVPSGIWHMRGRLPDTWFRAQGSNNLVPMNRIIRNALGDITYLGVGSLYIPAVGAAPKYMG
jgi:hypothetical protein